MSNTKNNKINITKVEIIRSEISRDWINFKENQVSKTFRSGQQDDHHKVWDLPPIDFTPKIYFQPQKKSHKIGLGPHRVETEKATYQKDNKQTKIIENFYKQTGNNRANEKFTTRFRIDSAHTDRRKTLRTGFHSRETYYGFETRRANKDIHRHLDTVETLEKEDFVVNKTISHTFQNEALKMTIPELTCQCTNPIRTTTFQMVTTKIKEPKFDNSLILPKSVYAKGRSSQDVLYDAIAKTTDLFPLKEKYGLDRPNLKDNKTMDFLEITRTGPRHK